jgi:hypothetical protein
MTKEERYNDLYQKAENLMAIYNPCKSLDGKCKAGDHYYDDSFCCDNCKYSSKEGCSVESLFCKLWTCRKTELLQSREFKLEQHKLLNEAFYHKLLIFRGSKEDVLSKDLTMKECIKNISKAENMNIYAIRKYCYTSRTSIIIVCGDVNTLYRVEV